MRGTTTQKNSTGFVAAAAKGRNASRGVKATSTSGKAHSTGVSAVPAIEIADIAAHAPRIQRVLTFQSARSSRSSAVGASRPRTQRTTLLTRPANAGGVVVVA